jgi:parvulin-like peptidyl-prolyl isomerase
VKRLLAEPLLHFAVLGGLVYGSWAAFGKPSEPAADVIVVDEQTLLNHMQYRAKAFEPEYFSAQLAAMDPAGRQQLIDEYVREESLYREAEALNLAAGDYVIKLRMIQKMEYLLEDLNPVAAPDAAELERYFAAHQEQYRVADSWTFTHVFFDAEARGDEAAREQGKAALVRLNADQVNFSAAVEHGDRFPFLQNYVERTGDYIADHFGQEFANSLRDLPLAQWSGPIKSQYGHHLVYIATHAPAQVPALAEIRGQVEQDYLRDAHTQAQERAIAELRKSYRVQVAESLSSPR